LLMGAQISLGILWFFFNLNGMQAFKEAEELLEISETWVLDDYVGLVYPAVLWVLRKICRGWYMIPLYLLQLAAVFCAGCFFLDRTGVVKRDDEGKRTLKLLAGGGYLATAPLIMQFIAAQLPYAFGLAVFLVVLAEGLFLCKKGASSENGSVKSLLVILGGWILGALILPDYKWLMSLPVLLSFAVYMWRKKKCYPVMILLFAGTFLLNVFVAELYQEPGSRGRMEKSLSGALLRRCVWPNFERDYFFWSHNVKILYPAEDMISISCEPENVVYDFGYRMEETYGTKLAKEEYMLMVRTEWEVRTKELVTEIVRDGLGYLCPQITTNLHFNGIGVSYSSWNYHAMNENTPWLTVVYTDVSNISFCMALLLLGIAGVLCLKKIWKRIFRGEVFFVTIFVAWMSLWYTMSASGMWDYKNVLPVTALWVIGIVYGWSKLECKENENA